MLRVRCQKKWSIYHVVSFRTSAQEEKSKFMNVYLSYQNLALEHKFPQASDFGGLVIVR